MSSEPTPDSLFGDIRSLLAETQPTRPIVPSHWKPKPIDRSPQTAAYNERDERKEALVSQTIRRFPTVYQSEFVPYLATHFERHTRPLFKVKTHGNADLCTDRLRRQVAQLPFARFSLWARPDTIEPMLSLPEASHIQRLELRSLQDTGDTLLALADSDRPTSLDSLTHLSLRGCELKDEDVIAFANALTLPNLRCLNLRDQPLGEDAHDALASKGMWYDDEYEVFVSP